MTSKILFDELLIEVGDPVELKSLVKNPNQRMQDFKKSVEHLNGWGIYFIRHHRQGAGKFNPYSESIIYIGKASGKIETIFARCKKHYYSMIDARYKNGKPRTKPGRNFIAYRNSINKNPENHWVYPAIIKFRNNKIDAKSMRLIISIVEKLYLKNFNEKNNCYPRCNTNKC